MDEESSDVRDVRDGKEDSPFLDVEGSDKDEYVPDVDEDRKVRKKKRRKKRKSKRKLRKRKRRRRRVRRTKGFHVPMQVSILVQSPLVKENFYDARFKAFGGSIAFSIPLTHLSPKIPLHVEAQLATMFSSVATTQPPIEFNHAYIGLPVRLKAMTPLNKSRRLIGEVFLGYWGYLFEWDSREGDTGGFRSSDDFSDGFTVDFGVGFTYRMSRSWGWRLTLSVPVVAIGASFTL